MDSILTSTKKILGLAEEYTVFDHDILIFINSALSTAEQIGVGLTIAYVEDANLNWDDLALESDNLAMLKNYVYLKARLGFDPPPTSFAIEAMEKQIAELEWRMRVRNEVLNYEGEIV